MSNCLFFCCFRFQLKSETFVAAVMLLTVGAKPLTHNDCPQNLRGQNVIPSRPLLPPHLSFPSRLLLGQMTSHPSHETTVIH